MSEEIIKSENACTDENCDRKHRPNGEHYSKDPAERMKQMQAEGRVGGSQFGQKGGRPRKPRASEIVSEKIREEGENMANVFKKAINGPDTRLALDATEKALKIEATEAKLRMEEERHEKEMSRDEIVGAMKKMLTDNPVLKLALENLMTADLNKYDYDLTQEMKELNQ